MINNRTIKHHINSVSDMFHAHPKLNIYIQHSKKLYKLGRDTVGEWTITVTPQHLIIQPSIIVG